MIHSIRSFASNAYTSLPTLKLATLSNMIKKTTTIALADNSLAKLICQTLCLFAK